MLDFNGAQTIRAGEHPRHLGLIIYEQPSLNKQKQRFDNFAFGINYQMIKQQ